MANKNSMFYWWPLVKGLKIPQPKTVMVPFKGRLDRRILDGSIEDGQLVYKEENLDAVFQAFMDKVKAKAAKIGYPLFMRSGETSNKFDWGRSCYVTAEKQLFPNLCNIIEFIEMSFTLSFDGVALREFLELDKRFTSHEGMPVAAEWRLFVKNGVVECSHPYWPPTAIRDPSIENWREVLDELQLVHSWELIVLNSFAKMISEVLGGYWSIDFCRHENGLLYLTDMALGKDSYHWSTCEFAPPEMMEHYGDPLVKDTSQVDAFKLIMERLKADE